MGGAVLNCCGGAHSKRRKFAVINLCMRSQSHFLGEYLYIEELNVLHSALFEFNFYEWIMNPTPAPYSILSPGIKTATKYFTGAEIFKDERVIQARDHAIEKSQREWDFMKRFGRRTCFVNAAILFAWFPLNCIQFKPRSFHPCRPYARAAAASSNVCRLPHHPPSFGVCRPVPSTSQRARIPVRLMVHHPSLRCRYTVNVGYC